MDDLEFGNALIAQGLLSEEELREAIWERQRLQRMGKIPPFLWDVLIQKGYLSRVQVDEALAAMQHRRRYCAACEQIVAVPTITPDGERCSKCGGPVTWKIEKPQPESNQDTIMALAGEVPADVDQARHDPARVLGKYVLVEEAGHGGAGVVYKAWDLVLQQYVAVKLLRNLGDNARISREDQIKDLIREARNAIRLRHPNIVPVFDAAVIDKQFFICMEYIEGDSLAAHLRASHKRNRISPLYEDPIRYLEIMRDVCLAIHYAHTFPKPIVHCDLKPGNILLNVNLHPYIVDFGLARQANMSGTPAPDDETAGPHLVRGTPAYMAPEQLSGRPEDLGPWTDIYGLGAILYELLTGHPVFLGNAYEVMMKALRETPKAPSVVMAQDNTHQHDETSRILRTTKLEAITMKCISKDRLRRYGSAKEVAEDLDKVIQALRTRRPTDQAGIIPQAIQNAQAHADLRHVEEQMTAFELEVAFKEVAQLEAAWKSGEVGELARDRQRQVKCVEAFKERMIDRMNKWRPKLAKLELLDRSVANVEILRATEKIIVIFHNSESVELVWQAFKPEQIVSLAWDILKMDTPEDRLALGIYCKYARLGKLARFFLQSLVGTPFEAAAKPLIETTAS